jgi:hypothetical protein
MSMQIWLVQSAGDLKILRDQDQGFHSVRVDWSTPWGAKEMAQLREQECYGVCKQGTLKVSPIYPSSFFWKQQENLILSIRVPRRIMKKETLSKRQLKNQCLTGLEGGISKFKFYKMLLWFQSIFKMNIISISTK